jgi:sec-independent protein translocase protein TatB
MFDVGFSELALIFGVSLVVLGPKRLPGLVKKVGRWVGKARAMARDFQQQLENEVNLEELNKMTEQVARDAQGITPSPPPDFTGDPPAAETSTYPYSAQDPSTAETSVAEASPAEAPPAESPATDDTYSHAHAAGDAPMPDVAEHASTDSAQPEMQVQADLDLSAPDDDSHLPPDDARRHS